MEVKKFISGPRFLSPILEGHNEVVDNLDQKIGKVSGANGLSVIKTGKDLSISLNHSRTHFRFGIVQSLCYRGSDSLVQMCEYSGNEWHRSKYVKQVDTQFLTGFYFIGMPVRLLELPETKILQIISDGVSYARFWLEEDLTTDDNVVCRVVDYPNHKDNDEYPEGTNEVPIWAPWGGTLVEQTDEEDEDGVNVGTEEDPEYIIPKKLGCFWNDGLRRWEAGLEKCE